MFEKKPTNSEPQKPVPSIDKLSIHTMKKDLANPLGAYAVKNPAVVSQPVQTKNTERVSPQIKTSSPFLTEAPSNNKISVAKKASEPIENKILIKNPGSKHIFPVIVIVLIVSLAVGGGYYFWKTRVAPSWSAKKSASQNQEASAGAATLPAIATDKPNYLSIDTKNPDASAIKKTLADYAGKVTQTKTVTPVAFIVTDAQNNPISFQDFAQAVGLTLPQSLTAQLGPGFTLYMYNDAGKTRIGLATAEKNDAQLAAALIQEESNLPKDIEPLFLASSYTLNNRSFGSSTYNGIPIRYNNIISPDNLSVDYTIYQNQWLIGTTELTLRSTVDLLNSQTAPTAGNNAANSQ
ncbi:MAG: hypothetical protein P4L62_04800 [Candidatus Pacebacteria bacterium]|nr:hypothetical protein [Candidatus Paceibacterota bacterium]MDR3583649.1 hypothetical protein [Candidatus Paceibacterota bacterium]